MISLVNQLELCKHIISVFLLLWGNEAKPTDKCIEITTLCDTYTRHILVKKSYSLGEDYYLGYEVCLKWCS